MELTAAEAGAAVGMSHQAIRDHITAGRLSAARLGIRGLVKIDDQDLRTFATTYNYRLDEQYLTRLAAQKESSVN